VWSATEVNVAIIAASIPALKPLFKTVLGSSYIHSYSNYPSKRKRYVEYSRGPNHNLSSVHKSSGQRNRVDEEVFEMHGTTNMIRGGTKENERNGFGDFSTSEDFILPLQSNTATGGAGIMKTMQVYIETDGYGENDPGLRRNGRGGGNKK
jgi:hypothetical protein